MNGLLLHTKLLPRTLGFIKRSPMFRDMPEPSKASAMEVVKAAGKAYEAGSLRPGDRFPTPDQISKFSGMQLTESLKAVNVLLESALIRQDLFGRLSVAKVPKPLESLRPYGQDL